MLINVKIFNSLTVRERMVLLNIEVEYNYLKL